MFTDPFAFAQTMLDTLQAHIAVLDQTGNIIAVNEAWRRFGLENDLKTPNACLGIDYLAICDQVTDDTKIEASLVAAAIRDILAGHKDTADVEYPCHGPQEQRWFTAHITRFQTEGHLYLLIAHESITKNKLTESRYRLLAENITDVIWVLDIQENRFTYISPSIQQLRGYTVAEALTEKIEDALVPSSLEHLTTVLPPRLAAFYQGQDISYTDELEQWHKDGSTVWVEITSHFLINPDNRHLEVYGVSRNITDRKRIDAQLQYQAMLLQNVSDAILATDQSFILTHWNQAAAALYGWTAAEVLGLSVSDLLQTEYLSSTPEQVLQEFAAYGRWKGNVIQKRKDGAKRHIMASVSTINDATGQVVGVIATNRDITEQMLTEKALRQSEERFAKAFHFNPAALTITRLTDGRILDVNDAYTQLMGYQRDELVGRSSLELKIITSPEERLEVTRRLRETGSVRNYETVVYHRSGKKHHVLASLEPIEVNGEACILSALYDFTDRKEADLLLAEMMAELRRSNHDLEQFAYVASHDLQEPLRAVSGMVQLLQKRYAGQLDARADEYINHAVAAAARMQTLINDLLTFSRVGTKGNPFNTLSGEEILRGAIQGLKIAIVESGTIITHDPLPHITGDASQLTQLLQNLIGNAIKFRSEASPQIHISAEQLAGETCFAVRDNGIGIAPEYFERIFAVFQRLHTRQEYPGTGIGLSICKKIVERHRGRIWVTSQPGVGSTFYFTLPTPTTPLSPETIEANHESTR